jgi:hypothetical protein
MCETYIHITIRIILYGYNFTILFFSSKINLLIQKFVTSPSMLAINNPYIITTPFIMFSIG